MDGLTLQHGQWVGHSRQERDYRGHIVWRGAEFICHGCLEEMKNIALANAADRKSEKDNVSKNPYLYVQAHHL